MQRKEGMTRRKVERRNRQKVSEPDLEKKEEADAQDDVPTDSYGEVQRTTPPLLFLNPDPHDMRRYHVRMGDDKLQFFPSE